MRTGVPAILAIIFLCAGIGGAIAADATPAAAPSADAVLAALNASIEWYRDARVTMRDVNRAGALFAAEDQETARQALQRAFAVARGRAALLKQSSDAPAKPAPQQRLAEARAGLEAAIRAEEQWIPRAPVAERAAARRRLELERARLEIMKQMQGFNTALVAGAPTDLAQQIDALEQSVPEVRGSVVSPE